MNRKSTSWGVAILVLALVVPSVHAVSRIGIHGYTAAIDDVSGEALLRGQLVVHPEFDMQLREVVRYVPILSLQYAGRHYRQDPPADPNHAEARAQSVAERLVHAWTLMDHGARIEVATDNWATYQMQSVPPLSAHAAIYIRSPVAGSEPLRIITVYEQDVAGYPWVASEKSLAEYLEQLIQVHYLLFWRNESDIRRYEEQRMDRTRDGKIFKEIAMRALEVARLKGQEQFTREDLDDALARIPLSQRERLYRLAIAPPMDWDASLR